jgi:hypothetical protein
MQSGGGPVLSSVEEVVLANGSFVLLSSAAGIRSTGDSGLRIQNGRFDCSAVTLGPCFSAPSLLFETGSIAAVTGYQRLGPDSGWQVSVPGRIYFEYGGTSGKEGLSGIHVIHIGNLSLPLRERSILTIHEINGEFEGEVIFDAARSQGCAFSVPHAGTYTISFRSLRVNGPVRHEGNGTFWAAEADDNFYPNAEGIAPTPTPLATPTPVFIQSIPVIASPVFIRSIPIIESIPFQGSRELLLTVRLSESRHVSPSQFGLSASLSESDHVPPTELGMSASLSESGRLWPTQFGMSEEFDLERTDTFNSSPNLAGARAVAKNVTLSTWILLPIIAAAVAVLGLIGGCVVWRHRGFAPKGAGRGVEDGLVTYEEDSTANNDYVTCLNPNLEDDPSDILMDEQFE